MDKFVECEITDVEVILKCFKQLEDYKGVYISIENLNKDILFEKFKRV